MSSQLCLAYLHMVQVWQQHFVQETRWTAVLCTPPALWIHWVAVVHGVAFASDALHRLLASVSHWKHALLFPDTCARGMQVGSVLDILYKDNLSWVAYISPSDCKKAQSCWVTKPCCPLHQLRTESNGWLLHSMIWRWLWSNAWCVMLCRTGFSPEAVD